MKKKNNKMISKNKILEDPYGYTYEEIVSSLNEDEAQYLYGFLYKKKNKKYHTIKIKKVHNGGDTKKYIFELYDHYCIETVIIKRNTGITACISTMVGCPIGCDFCESGKNGFIRNLTPSEIVQQVMLLKECVNRIVFMGIGEPLLNYDYVIKSIHILRDRNGLNFRTDGITISTVGPIDKLKKLREEHIKIQLTVSLHATTQYERNKLIPKMSGNSIDEIVKCALSYSERHHRKITIAYLLIPGFNDKKSDIEKLAKWFVGKNVLINVLQYNNTNRSNLRKTNKQELVAFKRKLENKGLKVKIRESRGNKINAACGQLVSKYNKL